MMLQPLSDQEVHPEIKDPADVGECGNCVVDGWRHAPGVGKYPDPKQCHRPPLEDEGQHKQRHGANRRVLHLSSRRLFSE